MIDKATAQFDDTHEVYLSHLRTIREAVNVSRHLMTEEEHQALEILASGQKLKPRDFWLAREAFSSGLSTLGAQRREAEDYGSASSLLTAEELQQKEAQVQECLRILDALLGSMKIRGQKSKGAAG